MENTNMSTNIGDLPVNDLQDLPPQNVARPAEVNPQVTMSAGPAPPAPIPQPPTQPTAQKKQVSADMFDWVKYGIRFMQSTGNIHVYLLFYLFTRNQLHLWS